jgi:murein DD-endopeptidase MepM/ murein hydrolase activator NlpD
LQVKIREDTRAKEENMALLEEERRKKEAAKADSDRRLEELRRKKEVESQCYKDDLRRLQDELNRLQKSTGTNQPAVPSTNPPGMTNRSTARTSKQQPIQRPPATSNRPLPQPAQKPSRRRDCVVCKKEEAVVILLQCAHQVLCVGCNKLQEDKGMTRCPSCSAKVEERIRVFGASTN